MAFFLVKAAGEVAHGEFSEAWKTLTSGAPEVVHTLEDDVAAAFKAFLDKFGPAEAKTVLISLSTALDNGVKAGLQTATSGTIANAEAAATEAAKTLAQSAGE